jgi:hypothetical protein
MLIYLRESSDIINHIENTRKKQARLNGTAAAFVLAVTVYLFITETKMDKIFSANCKRDKKIEDLSNAIKELNA